VTQYNPFFAGEVTVKSISSGGEYVTLQKYFSHPSLRYSLLKPHPQKL
jgi:hypothetical protein